MLDSEQEQEREAGPVGAGAGRVRSLGGGRHDAVSSLTGLCMRHFCVSWRRRFGETSITHWRVQ